MVADLYIHLLVIFDYCFDLPEKQLNDTGHFAATSAQYVLHRSNSILDSIYCYPTPEYRNASFKMNSWQLKGGLILELIQYYYYFGPVVSAQYYYTLTVYY